MASSYVAVFTFAVVIAVTSGSSITRRQAPSGSNGVCGSSPCPSYSVVKQLENDLEERKYEPTQLPSYQAVQCMKFENAVNQAYFHLSMYTRAAQNAQRAPLQMGVPVLTKVQFVNDPESKCDQIYTTSFYVNATSLPAATNADIKVTPLADTQVYVQSINGYISEQEQSLVDLRIRLNSHKLCYDKTTYYVANYQSPGKDTQRHNEIWVPAASC